MYIVLFFCIIYMYIVLFLYHIYIYIPSCHGDFIRLARKPRRGAPQGILEAHRYSNTYQGASRERTGDKTRKRRVSL